MKKIFVEYSDTCETRGCQKLAMPKGGKKYVKKPMKGKATYKNYYKKKYNDKTSLFQEKAHSVERKSVDVVQNAGALPATNGWTLPALINTVVQGVSSGNRLGRRYTNVSFQYRMTTAGMNGTGLRVLVLYDRSPNGVLPAILDILAADNYNSPMNLGTSDRFLIVSDKIYTAANDGTATGVSAKDYKKISLDSLCTGAGGTIADIGQGALYLMAANALGNAATFQLHTRLRFTDA